MVWGGVASHESKAQSSVMFGRQKKVANLPPSLYLTLQTQQTTGNCDVSRLNGEHHQ